MHLKIMIMNSTKGSEYKVGDICVVIKEEHNYYHAKTKRGKAVKVLKKDAAVIEK